MRKAKMGILVAGLAVVVFAVSCTSRTGPSSASNSQSASANSQQECKKQRDVLNGSPLGGSEDRDMVAKVKAMSNSEKIAIITNSIEARVSQAEPGTYTAALNSNGSRADTIVKAMDAYREFQLAQAKDFLIQAGKKRADVDQLTDPNVVRMFLKSLEESGCKREDTDQNREQR